MHAYFILGIIRRLIKEMAMSGRTSNLRRDARAWLFSLVRNSQCILNTMFGDVVMFHNRSAIYYYFDND